MLITNHFIYIHLPKTGGEFLKRVCEQALPQSWHVEHSVGKHQGRGSIPEAYRSLPQFALIRNPWDWYVSWYHYLRRGHSTDPTWLLVSDHRRYEFVKTIENLLMGQHAVPRVARIMKEKDVDLLTVHHWDMFGPNPKEHGIVVAKLEEMPGCFERFLADHQIEVEPRFIEALRSTKKINVSIRRNYQHYYTDHLRALVKQKSRFIIEKYGYEFEEVSSMV